jgi:hypothetical protein
MEAIAVIMDVQDNMEITRLRLDKARKILGMTHEGPRAYDPETPAGMRPKGKAK